MIVTSNLIPTPKVVTIDQNRWSRSVKFTGHDLLEWVVTVDQNTQMCNKLCNCLFSDVLAKRPALDAWRAMAGIRASRVWTLGMLWTGRGCPESGR